MAQGTISAITFPPGGITGYANTNGVGWSFVPTQDLLVTAVISSGPQIDFWQGTNQVIATYFCKSPGGDLMNGPSTNFETVPSLLLRAGQSYFVTTQDTNMNRAVNFWFFGLNGFGGLTPFSASSYLTQVASYYVSADGLWYWPYPTINNSDVLILGPNFQFQVVPEPPALALAGLAFAAALFMKIGKLCPIISWIFEIDTTKRGSLISS